MPRISTRFGVEGSGFPAPKPPKAAYTLFSSPVQKTPQTLNPAAENLPHLPQTNPP